MFASRAVTLFGGCAVAAVVINAGTAEAKITCKDQFQVSGGRLISTPYCQDEYLAEVAREYGIQTTGSKMRNSFSAKVSVCRTVGYDIRVRENCLTVLPDSRGKRRFWP